MKITNKQLLSVKNNRFEMLVFDEQGYRKSGYGNIDIITANTEVIKNTMNGFEILLTPFDENKSIKIITTLESNLHRRATKKEIIDFINNDYKLL